MRGATIFSTRSAHWRTHFNPRSSCEERLVEAAMMRDASMISIHAPHARSDGNRRQCPAWQGISIHAPHARSDHQGFAACHGVKLISIHAPHARSDAEPAAAVRYSYISIHAPHARSDTCYIIDAQTGIISIHAPHARSDLRYHIPRRVGQNFNPRSSCEERPKNAAGAVRGMLFQSTLLMRGATQPSECTRTPGDISIHAPHARSDTTDTNKRKCGDISIHAPHARSDIT